MLIQVIDGCNVTMLLSVIHKYTTFEIFWWNLLFQWGWSGKMWLKFLENSLLFPKLAAFLQLSMDEWLTFMYLNFSGESIPIRLFLSPYELTPTHRNINNKFSVKYYLNLVLVDEEDRRYFKQQEITIYRLQETSWSLISHAISIWSIRYGKEDKFSHGTL